MNKVIRIGTRESQLAVWQATLVQNLLKEYGFPSELVYIKSEGDIDLKTPLYEMGVQGIFTRSLDIALLSDKIDIAVHSMKDVPTQLPKGIVQAAALKRANYKDLFVYNDASIVNRQSSIVESLRLGQPLPIADLPFTIASSSVRRRAQWLNRYPSHLLENMRGNVNTRLRKVEESNWSGAIFAAAGLERINLRPKNAIELDWMLPAPAQGAIMVVCRDEDYFCLDACENFDHSDTQLCTKIERDFLKTLLGGCTTPISALAVVKDGQVYFKGSLLSVDGKYKFETEAVEGAFEGYDLGVRCANEILKQGGKKIIDQINAAK